MKRCAFTIVFNGLHHLKHNNFVDFMTKTFDHWVISEGAAGNHGSTSWCNPAMEDYHDNGRSIDGTVYYLKELKNRAHNVSIVQNNTVWRSKDDMVNAALYTMRKKCKNEYPFFLWEVDVDEQWTCDAIKSAESDLVAAGAKTGMFLADYYVGEGMVARGEWGEGSLLPYNRLWLWDGERFEKHEPPVLEGGNDPAILLPQRFNHYAYYFEKDVIFKDEWYGRHDGIYDKWLALQKLPRSKFPVPISELLPFQWGGGKTEICLV